MFLCEIFISSVEVELLNNNVWAWCRGQVSTIRVRGQSTLVSPIKALPAVARSAVDILRSAALGVEPSPGLSGNWSLW